MIPYSPSANSREIYAARYLDKDAPTIDALHRRVSGGNDTYYRLMNEGVFLPNSPTLFNAGTKLGGTLSACFVFSIADALLGDWPDGGCPQPFADSIAGTTFKAMAVAKAGGGVGYYLGNLRPEGSEVKSTHKRACGPVGVLHWLNRINQLITQGGKRALAQMGVLPCWHPDFRKFIHCKDDHPEELSSFNISGSWTDEWLNKVDFDANGRAITAEETETGLWWEHVGSAWRTGCPGVLFWSTVNFWNATPHLGTVDATNPCGETPNLTNEPCNLGSAALSRFFKRVGVKWVFLWDEFKQRVREMIRFMDDILDWNVFPHPDITKAAMATRKLGLGAMGYADALALQRIPYDCQEAVDWGGEVMKVLNEEAFRESHHLAGVKGPYPAWEATPDDWKKRFPWCRNSTRTSIAPTGTIGLLADASSSIEPHYELEWERTTNEGIKLKERIPVADRLGDFVPKTAHQVAPEWHIKHQAAFQKHTNLGVSKTINLPNHATVRDVSEAYRLMWQSGCKGGTIYRDGCRPEQVLVAKKKKTSVYTVTRSEEPVELPNDVPQLPRHKFRAGGTKCYLHVGTTPDGKRPIEVFLTVSKAGSALRGLLDAWAIQVSNNLQRGIPVEKLVELHGGTRFEPCGVTGNPDVPLCSSIPDYVVRYLQLKFAAPKHVTEITVRVEVEGAAAPAKSLSGSMRSGELCPDCGQELFVEAGCLTCHKPGCGYSRCG